MTKFVTIDEAINCIQSFSRIFIHGGAATPKHLLEALLQKKDELEQVELVSITTIGEIDLSPEALGKAFRVNSLFVSKNVREAVNVGLGDYIPIFLSEIPILFRAGHLPIDVALITVSPPDQHGNCTLGTSIDIVRSAIQSSKLVIAQINKQMPRTHGDSVVSIKQVDIAVVIDEPLPEVDYSSKVDETALTIGRYVSTLVEDGATLQMGIGAIPNAVLSNLQHHQHLGVHTEMFSDGLLPLIKSGVVDNSLKKKHRGKVVTSFVVGSKSLYNFIDDNALVSFLDVDYVNDTSVIRTNPRVTAINAAIEIDLTGQVCSDSIGTYQYSGVGGQMDFIRGAALSEGGKPIIALKSITKEGYSKIVPFLKEGAGVVTSRAHVHYVVTEFGIAYLFGKNLKQRALELLNIAHPMHHDWLSMEIYKRFG